MNEELTFKNCTFVHTKYPLDEIYNNGNFNENNYFENCLFYCNDEIAIHFVNKPKYNYIKNLWKTLIGLILIR